MFYDHLFWRIQGPSDEDNKVHLGKSVSTKSVSRVNMQASFQKILINMKQANLEGPAVLFTMSGEIENQTT